MIEDKQFFAFVEGEELIANAQVPMASQQVESSGWDDPFAEADEAWGKAQRQTQKRDSGLPVDAGGNKPKLR